MRNRFIIPMTVLCTAALCLYAQDATQLPNAKDSVKFAVIGDNGTGNKPEYQVADKLAAARQKLPFEFVLMLGDNLYGGEATRDFMNKFEKPYMPLLDMGVKFYATLGNHDDPSRQISYEKFNMGGKHYYSFKPKGNVRFFSLDSNYM